jgi:hypothetical protein
MGFYRTFAALSVLLGINIAVRLFNIPVDTNLILGNHIVEAAAALTVVSLLVDLRILNSEIQTKYFKIGLIAFFAGIIMVAASFSSLFVWNGFVDIVAGWFKIAPQIIFLIGVPALYIADKLAQKNKLFGMDNVGKRGVLNLVLICTAFTVAVIWTLYKYNILMLE